MPPSYGVNPNTSTQNNGHVDPDAALSPVLVDSAQAMETIAAALPDYPVYTLDNVLEFDPDELLAAVADRDLLIVLPLRATKSARQRAADCRVLTDRLAHAVRVVLHPGRELSFPRTLDTQGSRWVWLDNLPEMPAQGKKPSANHKGHKPAAVFRNFVWVKSGGDDKTEDVRAPLRAAEISAELTEVAGPWPKRVAEKLFIQTADYRPVDLTSPPRLFAWIDGIAPVDWTKGGRFISQERFYERLRMTAEQYDSIETLPHYPPLPRTYYMHAALPKPTGALETLLDCFAPLTPLDRELIKAFLMTPLWGGQPGSRPAFLITGPDRDEEQGRGVGKTTLIQVIADEIFGGAFKGRQSKDFDDMVTRLLTPDARQQRIALLDNLKTFNFSWADLEDLITASTISGRELYVGDSRRPNYLVWAITLNGATLSKDMAQRVIPIKLARPTFKAEWEPSVRTFAREHRTEIIADVGDLLTNARESITPATRWAAWEADVLAATINPAATQRLIVERQGDVDAGNSDREIVRDYFSRQIREAGIDPDTQAARFNSQTATKWVNEAMNAKHDATRASGFLGGLNIPELTRNRSMHGRFWIWRDVDVDPDLDPFDVA